MEIKILYDNKAFDESFLSGWGFSCLVDGRILFDTGEGADALFHNMKNLELDVQAIEAVVLSHDHRDHTGGLSGFLKKRPGLPVYCPPNVSDVLKHNIEKAGGRFIGCASLTEIRSGVYVTGEMAGRYKMKYLPEQALVIQAENGLVIITGCAHPGIVDIAEAVRGFFQEENIYGVIGGFHMSGLEKSQVLEVIQKMHDMKVKKTGPAHCTGAGAQKLFQSAFQENFVAIKAGLIFDI